MFTPEATRKAVKRIRAACERIDRDPASVRVCVPVVTAPDMDEAEAISISGGRLVNSRRPRQHAHAVRRCAGRG
ncbi:hypothetical protein ACIGT4_17140 [Streptomyces sioyaensis]|uniref:hypothetical protein n=1 Tax=Streptomyces sioyaensis TaxID=67364 RepID=UPI0037D8D4AE